MSTEKNTEFAELLTSPTTWLTDTAERVFLAAQLFLPNLLVAVVILLLGWVSAWLARFVILRFGRGMDRILTALHLETSDPILHSQWSVSTIVGNLTFWIIIAFSIVNASNELKLVFLANWLQDLLNYLPRLLISGVIFFIGKLTSDGLRDFIRGYATARNIQQGAILAQMVGWLVLAFALLLALDQLGLDIRLLENIIVLSFAAFFGGTALAFGLGAADSVRNIMASHYLRKQYQPGLRVKVGDQEGEILELTPVAVLLDTDSGQALIPTRIFMETASVILEPENQNE
ncbi:MAG: mechanosensitive ion channel [Candidatus Thiodiazotropha sp. (ex Ctena orbiculata)]|nr:mechanosensitive ion channel [Candidatus Thiodiazotropha taylori]